MNAKTAADFADRCRNDPEYRAKVHADPVAAVAEYGVAVPDSVQDVRVVENTGDTVYYVFPADPNGAMSDDDLNWVAGGVFPEQGGFRPHVHHAHHDWLSEPPRIRSHPRPPW